MKSLLQPPPAASQTPSTTPNRSVLSSQRWISKSLYVLLILFFKSSNPPSGDKDETSELTKLIEIMTSSNRLSGVNTQTNSAHTATVSSESALDFEDYKFRVGEEHHPYVSQCNPYVAQSNPYVTEYSQQGVGAGGQWSGTGKQRKQKQYSDESEQGTSYRSFLCLIYLSTCIK